MPVCGNSGLRAHSGTPAHVPINRGYTEEMDYGISRTFQVLLIMLMVDREVGKQEMPAIQMH